MLQPYLPDARFLDLFLFDGSVGFQLLSPVQISSCKSQNQRLRGSDICCNRDIVLVAGTDNFVDIRLFRIDHRRIVKENYHIHIAAFNLLGKLFVSAYASRQKLVYMRVIAGKCRSLPLKTVPGRQTRPTTDRIKETLFNMLQPYLPDARFLDLFAGSGAIGIEALSRGAERAWFVEQNKAAADCIRQNLKFTKLEQQAVLLPMEAHAALQSLQGQEPFDCIFMDPPYDKGLEKDVLYAFRDASFIGEDTLIIVEASLNTDFDWAEDAGYEILKKKIYKTNVHVFLTPKSKQRRF